MRKVVRTEGFLALYRGNGAQMARIFPYSAIQFTSFEFFKRRLPKIVDKATNGRVSGQVVHFLSGSCAGITAVSFTFPLDTVRARLAFQTKDDRRYRGIVHTFKAIITEVSNMFKMIA